MVVIGRSLLIFSDVTFKMAAWRPYWIFGFRTQTLVWLWISTPNFNVTILMHMGRSLWIFSDVCFLWFSAMSLSKWPPGGHIGFFGFRTLTLVWLWISTPNFNGTILMHMGRSLLIFSDVCFCDILSVYWCSILFLPWVNSNKKTSMTVTDWTSINDQNCCEQLKIYHFNEAKEILDFFLETSIISVAIIFFHRLLIFFIHFYNGRIFNLITKGKIINYVIDYKVAHYKQWGQPIYWGGQPDFNQQFALWAIWYF